MGWPEGGEAEGGESDTYTGKRADAKGGEDTTGQAHGLQGLKDANNSWQYPYTTSASTHVHTVNVALEGPVTDAITR